MRDAITSTKRLRLSAKVVWGAHPCRCSCACRSSRHQLGPGTRRSPLVAPASWHQDGNGGAARVQALDDASTVLVRTVLAHLPLAWQIRDGKLEPDDALQVSADEHGWSVRDGPPLGPGSLVGLSQPRYERQEALLVVEEP
jgi:hypothetical protein